jgi:hypothetical protein
MMLLRQAPLRCHSERSVSGFLLPADCAFGILRARREVEESLCDINQGQLLIANRPLRRRIPAPGIYRDALQLAFLIRNHEGIALIIHDFHFQLVILPVL